MQACADNITFIVGTGRCGSTMLSRILHEHPDILSLSEFFTSVRGALPGAEIRLGPMDGKELWQAIADPDPLYDAAIGDGLKIPEMSYPYGSGRFSPASGVPKICHATLPLLSNDPDSLYDRLSDAVPGWPRRPAADSYLALFAFLGDLLGRRVVVERSGGALANIGLLRDVFPNARFVHLYRSGPDCALSMSRHPIFRFGALAQAAALAASLPWPSSIEAIFGSLPDEFYGLLLPPFDADRFMAYPLPLSWFGQRWSESTCEGVASLKELPAGSWTSLRYEDLLQDPDKELARLASFLGVPAGPSWLGTASRLMDRDRIGMAATKLDVTTLAELAEACAVGERALESL